MRMRQNRSYVSVCNSNLSYVSLGLPVNQSEHYSKGGLAPFPRGPGQNKVCMHICSRKVGGSLFTLCTLE